MRYVIVSSAEVAAAGTLRADYWVNRRGGETVEEYDRRQAAAAELAKAMRSLARARQQLTRAIELGGNSGNASRGL